MAHRWQFALQAVVLIAAMAPSAHVRAQLPDPQDPAATAQTRLAEADEVPVSFRDAELFRVREPIGGLAVRERAAAIERRIAKIASGSPDVLGQLRIEEHGDAAVLYAGDVLICTVTDADALPTGRTHQQLAADYSARLHAALSVEFRDRSVSSLLRSVLFAALATVVLIALLIGVRRVYVWLRTILAHSARKSRGFLWLSKLDLISHAGLKDLSRSLASAIAIVISLAAILAYLQFVLGQFPWTRGAADKMYDAASSAVVTVIYAVGGYVPKLINILVIVFVTRFAIRGLSVLFRQIGDGRLTIQGFYPEWAQPTLAIIRFLLIAVATVMVFPYLPGSGSEGFRGVSVFVGLLVSLGAASAIANIIAGLVITYMRPFRNGDRVKIADAVGDVTGKDLFVVRLRTIKNVDITIPNALVLANHIINYSSSAEGTGLILHTTVTIGYSAPWRKLEELLVAAARRTEGIIDSPPPFVLQTKLDDFYVHYEINAYTKSPCDMATIYSALNANIQDACNEAGVEIMSPHYGAVRDGNHVAIPDEHLPKNYRAPVFSIFSAGAPRPES
jgi:small-conductance mechanosensitive channel